jgi:hypothetical protein
MVGAAIAENRLPAFFSRFKESARVFDPASLPQKTALSITTMTADAFPLACGRWASSNFSILACFLFFPGGDSD